MSAPTASRVDLQASADSPAGLGVRRTLVLVIYGLVLAAFVPVAHSGEVGVVAPVLFVAAMLASLVRDPHASAPRPQTARWWTAALLAAFAGLVLWSLQDGNWLLHALQFALLMTLSRFFQRRFAKDYLQLLALSFILLLVAAVIDPGPLFAVCFLAYAVLVMWGLTVLHLVREIELQTGTGPEHLLPPPPPPSRRRRWLGLRAPLPPPPAAPPAWPDTAQTGHALEWRSRRLIGPRFLATTTLLALAVLAASALFFFLFPRLGMGFFFARTRGQQSVVGFGTDADLRAFGAIKTNAAVVARVQFPDDPARLELPIRLRGISFDDFQGTGWTRQGDPGRELPREGGTFVLRQGRPKLPLQRWRADIYLEPLGNQPRVFFAPPGTVAAEILDVRFDYLRGRRRVVRVARSGDLIWSDQDFQGKPATETALHYLVEVAEPADPQAEAALLRAAETELPERVAARWTSLPPDLDPRIAELARELAGPSANRYDQALALEAALRTQWTYSLAGDQDPERPLHDFLFGKKRGHCEFFATSMALMLRTLGHAARPVHGFHGGVLNPYGGYRAIRQADAHAWVEVFFPGVGWRTFDPTPPAGLVVPEEGGVGSHVRQLLDSAALVWYQWVVEYDLDRQIEVLKGIGAAFKSLQRLPGLSGRGDRAQAPTPDEAAAQTGSDLPWPGLAAAAALALALVVLRQRRLRQAGGFDPAVDRALARLQRLLARRGLQRQPWETWQVVAERVARQEPAVGARIAAFSETYDRARYAPADATTARSEAAERARTATAAVAAWLKRRDPRPSA